MARPGPPGPSLSFVVFGATGAVGGACVRQLLEDPSNNVFTVTRRALDVDPPNPRLRQIVVELDDIDKNPDIAKQLDGKVDIALCALGTTRKAAGSAEAFKRVDVEYVGAAARLCKNVGVRSFGLVSAQGANSQLWASDMKFLHGLLYAKSKGVAEDLVKEQRFPYTVIARPGLLERGSAARFAEKMGSWILPSVHVDQVARSLIARTAANAGEAGGGPGGSDAPAAVVEVLEMADLRARTS